MKNLTFFSIVIPVYNGLTHGLPVCLESIWKQPLEDSLYEVICVDDCSSDGTREWLNEQQRAHGNLRIIKNPVNIRQGGGRNRGMDAACGKYILFIDQDDYYHQGALQKVYEHLQESDLEILIVDCAYQSPGKESNVLQHNFLHKEIMTGDEIMVRNSIPYAPWKFVFLRSLVIDNKLYFVENERIEDVDWVHVLTHHAQRVQYQPILFIHYNKTGISTTMTSYKSPVTTYSTLKLSCRLRNLANSTFAESKMEVRRHILNIGKTFFYLGLRNYFFIQDKTRTKVKYIREAKGDASYVDFSNKLVKFAILFPNAFSFVSNCSAPFARLLMRGYRKWKYR